jgi:transcriptional regulator with XRE-family HTH domain
MKTIRAKMIPIREVYLPGVGSRITELRKECGWTKQELANRTGLRPERISRLERGLREASLTEAARLADALGASLDELVHGPAAAPASQEEASQAPERPEGSGA